MLKQIYRSILLYTIQKRYLFY